MVLNDTTCARSELFTVFLLFVDKVQRDKDISDNV